MDPLSNLLVGECLGGSNNNMVGFSLNIPLLGRGDSRYKKLNFRHADFERLRILMQNLSTINGSKVTLNCCTFKGRFIEPEARFVIVKSVIPANLQPK